MTAVYQGEPGAYSEAAAEALLPGARLRGLDTFRAVFEAVASGTADRGVVPVENSIAGSVGGVVDGLVAFESVQVIGERWDRIGHALLALEGTALEDVREVRSHPQALAQCAAALEKLLPEACLVAAADTAGAARAIADEQPAGVAAIASVRAAERYGLAILAEDIASDATNVTRFLVLAPPDVEAERGPAMKTTLVLAPRDGVPNALFRSMTAFVGRRLAVQRLEPRPRLGQPGHYRYLIDVDGNARADALAAALVDVNALCDEVRVVGSYPVGPIPSSG